MNITLVRHGETVENVNSVIQGHLPGKLTAKGQMQARDLADKLRHHKFDVIYISDLGRCVKTSKPILVHHENTQVIYSVALRERKCGKYEGRVHDEFFWQSLPGSENAKKYPGGESWLEVKKRMKPFLNQLFAEYPSGSVLIITHGGPLRSIRSLLEGKSLGRLNKEGTPNAGIWVTKMTKKL